MFLFTLLTQVLEAGDCKATFAPFDMHFTRIIKSFHWLVVIQSQEGKKTSHLSEIDVFLGAHCPFFVQSGNTWFVVVQSQEDQAASHLSEFAVFLGAHYPCFVQLWNMLQTCIEIINLHNTFGTFPDCCMFVSTIADKIIKYIEWFL